ncbi:MAG: hypothetical protein AB1598_06095 [Thermodesulfobacteriota bacterium]
MRNVLNTLLGLSLFVFVILGISGSASAQQCFLEICKFAEGAGETGFTINFDEGGQTFSVELFDGGDCFTESFGPSPDLEVTETPTPGWTLLDVVCQGSSDISFTSIPEGIDADCNTTAEASATCTFVNGRGVAANVPTLSEWGMIAAAGGLVLIGVFFALRRRRAFNS